MSIVRTVKNTNYTTISNVILNDERLSWKARGIAAYLLSKPDDWRVNYEHLVRSAPDGKSAVLAAMKELEACGYLERRKFQADDGRWQSEVVLHETPCACSPSTENRHPATGEKPSTDFPTVGAPEVGAPEVGKPAPLLSIDYQSLRPIPENQSLTTHRRAGGTRRNGVPVESRQALTDEQLALKSELIDAGLSDAKAYEAAFHYPDDYVRGWLAATLDDLDAGKVESIGVLPWRLQQNREPPDRYRPADYSWAALEAAQLTYEAKRHK